LADSTKVIASRNMLVYVAPYSISNALPADTVLWGTTWGGSFVDQGYTSGGVHFTTEVTRGEIRVDQELDPVLRPATARTASMNTNLAQFSGAAIVSATGQGSVTTLAATTAVRGHDDYALGSTVVDNFYAIGFDLLAQDNEAIRVVGWRWQPTGSPTFDFTPEAAALIPLNGSMLPDTSTTPARIATIRDIIPHS
jgi:hypothetical protein